MLARFDLQVKKVVVIRIEVAKGVKRQYYMTMHFPYEKREPNTLYVLKAYLPNLPGQDLDLCITYKWPCDRKAMDGKTIGDSYKVMGGPEKTALLLRFPEGTYCHSSCDRDNQGRAVATLSEEDSLLFTETVVSLYKGGDQKQQQERAAIAPRQSQKHEKALGEFSFSPWQENNDGWRCAHCTIQNAQDAEKCTVCGKEKPQGEQRLEEQQRPKKQQRREEQEPEEQQEPEEYKSSSSSSSWKKNAGIIFFGAASMGLFAHGVGVSGFAIAAGLTIPGWAIGMLAGGLAACLLVAVYSCCCGASPAESRDASFLANYM